MGSTRMDGFDKDLTSQPRLPAPVDLDETRARSSSSGLIGIDKRNMASRVHDSTTSMQRKGEDYEYNLH